MALPNYTSEDASTVPDNTSTAPGDILAKQNQALNELVSSLNQRQNPNWFSVAGALLNPGRTGSAGEAIGNAATEVGRQQEQQQQQAPNIAMIKAQLLGQQYQMGLKQQGMNMLSDIVGGGSPQEALKNLQSGTIAPSVARLATPKQIVGLMSVDKDMGNALKIGVELQQTEMKNAIELLGKGIELSKATSNLSQEQKDDLINNMGEWSKITGIQLPKSLTKESPQVKPEEQVPTTKFDVTKSYGTPPKLLDNLGLVESSNNPYAVNPESKTMGKYQFTPDTAAMLHKQGVKFNPFDPDESRAAADYHIQELVKQNGGDYRKALADYGGFKHKDPTAYVNSIMNGVDLGKQPTSTVNQPQPQTTPVQSSGLIKRYDETPEAFHERTKTTEAGAIKDFNELGSGLRLVNVDSLKSANADLGELKQLADYKRPDGTNPLFGTFQKRDIDSYSSAATKVIGDLLAKGGNVSIGDVKYNVGLDLKPTYNNIKLTDSEKVMRSRAENIISSQIIANIIANKTKAFGGSRVTNYQDQQLSNLNANVEQLPNYLKGWATRRQVDNAAMIKLSDEFNKFEHQAFQQNKAADPRGFFTSDAYRKDLPNEHTQKMNEALQMFPFK